MGQCGLHLTVLFGILRQWSISQAPRVTATSVAPYGSSKRKGFTAKQLFLSEWWSRYTEHTDVNINLPFTRSKFYLAAKEKKKERWKEKKMQGKAEEIMEQQYSSDHSRCRRPQPWLEGGLLWLARTNKAVWEHRVTTISSHHCQVPLPRHPHPHSNQCAHTALKWQRNTTIVTLHSIAY